MAYKIAITGCPCSPCTPTGAKSRSMRRTIKGRLERVQRSSVSLVQRHLLQGRRLRTALLDLTSLAINLHFYALFKFSDSSDCFAPYRGCRYKLGKKGASMLTRPKQAVYLRNPHPVRVLLAPIRHATHGLAHAAHERTAQRRQRQRPQRLHHQRQLNLRRGIRTRLWLSMGAYNLFTMP